MRTVVALVATGILTALAHLLTSQLRARSGKKMDQLREPRRVVSPVGEQALAAAAEKLRAREGGAPTDAMERVTADGALPTIFMGPPKAGTTSLFQLLKAHAQLDGPSRTYPRDPSYFKKEPHFFDTYLQSIGYAGGLDGVRHLRGYYPGAEARQGIRHYMDGTPNYFLNSENAAARLAQMYGRSPALLAKVRWVIVLREPMQWARSHWRHFSPNGWVRGMRAGDTMPLFYTRLFDYADAHNCSAASELHRLDGVSKPGWGEMQHGGGTCSAAW